jgi:hypothetical protein
MVRILPKKSGTGYVTFQWSGFERLESLRRVGVTGAF